MIDKALVFLRRQLNSYLELKSGWDPDASNEEKVVFVEGDKMDPMSFKLEAVTLLLINVEEENQLRSPDLYTRTSTDGRQQKIQPDIRLNLHVLLVAHFKQYEKGLHFLSLIIRFFQSNRLFDHNTTVDLNEEIGQLSLELVTLPFGEQNEIWSALRTTYHPSVLYKIKMLVFQDEDPIEPVEIGERSLGLGELGK